MDFKSIGSSRHIETSAREFWDLRRLACFCQSLRLIQIVLIDLVFFHLSSLRLPPCQFKSADVGFLLYDDAVIDRSTIVCFLAVQFIRSPHPFLQDQRVQDRLSLVLGAISSIYWKST